MAHSDKRSSPGAFQRLNYFFHACLIHFSSKKDEKMKISSFLFNCVLGFDARAELREIASTFDAEECKAQFSAGENGHKYKNNILQI